MNECIKTPLRAAQDQTFPLVWYVFDGEGNKLAITNQETAEAIAAELNRLAELGTLLERMHLQQLKRAIDIKDYVIDNAPITLVVPGYILPDLREAIARILGEE